MNKTKVFGFNGLSENGRLLVLASLLSLAVIFALPFQTVYAQLETPSEPPSEFFQIPFVPYKNVNAGISLDIPFDFVPKEAGPNDDKTAVVMFVSPGSNSTDPFVETLGINIEELGEGITLNNYTEQSLNIISTIFPDSKILTSDSNISLDGYPAHKVVYDATIDNNIDGRLMQVWSVVDGKAYVLTYRSEVIDYTFFLPDIERMVDSFSIITNGTGTMQSNMSGRSLESAREQYLNAWTNAEFGEGLSTFISQHSAEGYGVYKEHPSNIFNPGETITMYIEPVGFEHKPVLDNFGNTLYQMNLTASVEIADLNGNVLGSTEEIDPLLLTSHTKNTEVFLTIDLSQEQDFPEGEYVLTYTVKDGTNGDTFTIDKDIRIAQTVTQ